MRTGSLAGGAAALLGLSLAATYFAARPALAVVAAKVHSFTCNSSTACLGAANSGSGNGLQGTSASSHGVLGTTTAASVFAAGVFGESDSHGSGYGVAGRVSGNVSTHALWADGGSSVSIPMYITDNYAGYSPLLEASNGGSETLIADNIGSLAITGILRTAGSCYNGCEGTRKRVVTYGTMEAAPTVEDLGEARLAGSQAIIRLDPAFANVIDARAGYTVLLSPEGDGSTLYVAARSADRFTVRTVDGTPAELDFAYRIVAHPYGIRAPRLPLVHRLADAARLMEVR